MGDVIPFKKPKLQEKFQGRALCQRGFHKWQVEKSRRFDVKQGKLLTLYTCARCGATKTEAT